MNHIIRWGISCMLAVVMATGLCFVSLAEAGVFQQEVKYSQEEKKPDAAPAEDDEGCKC